MIPEVLWTKAVETSLVEGRRFWIVGPNYDDDEREWRVFYDTCKRLQLPMDKPGTYNDVVGGNMQMSLWGGKFMVECRSSAHPDSLDGEGLSGVLMVEAAKMKPSTWHKFIRPALSDKRGWSLHTSTPEGKNHFYEMWQRGQDPRFAGVWESWRMPSWHNVRVFPGGRDDPEILDMKAEMTEERFNQEVAAMFTEYVGRVFKNFDEEIHVKDLAYNPNWPLYGAVDYGWTNPFVWLVLQIDPFDNVYILGEYRAVHKDITEISSDLLRQPLVTNARTFFPDPEDPGATNVLEKTLKIKATGGTGGLRADRLDLIRTWLKPVPEHVPWEQRSPKLFINRICHEMIREMNDYRYPETKNELRNPTEEPMDKDNHGPEALGRFFKGYYTATHTRHRAVVRRAKQDSRSVA